MKSATKFFCVKTSNGKLVATSVRYLTVHRWIAGDVHIYLKFALKVTHPFRKRRFRQISLNSAGAERAGEKSSIIDNRKSTMRFLSSHKWILCVTPKSPKGWLKTRIFTFIVVFYFFVAGNRRHFKFDMWVQHNESQPTDDKPSLKWAWLRHVTYFKISSPLKIYLKRLKLKTSKFGVRVDHSKSQPTDYKLSLKGAWSLSCDLFNVWKINYNVSKMVQYCFIVSIKFE